MTVKVGSKVLVENQIAGRAPHRGVITAVAAGPDGNYEVEFAGERLWCLPSELLDLKGRPLFDIE